MLYFKVPIVPELLTLTPAQLTVYIHLLYLNFKFCGSGRQTTFFITDRSLSALSHRSKSVIYFTKKLLKEINLIDYWIGEGNVTTYKIPFPR